MRGKHRPEICPVNEVTDLVRCYSGVKKAADGLAEVITGPGTAHVEIFDAVLLLGNIGEVKIDGKGPHQMNGPIAVQPGQQIGEFGDNAGGAARLAKSLGKMAHFLNGIEKRLAVLADKGISQLMPQTPDIGPQRCIGSFGAPGN